MGWEDREYRRSHYAKFVTLRLLERDGNRNGTIYMSAALAQQHFEGCEAARIRTSIVTDDDGSVTSRLLGIMPEKTHAKDLVKIPASHRSEGFGAGFALGTTGFLADVLDELGFSLEDSPMRFVPDWDEANEMLVVDLDSPASKDEGGNE